MLIRSALAAAALVALGATAAAEPAAQRNAGATVGVERAPAASARVRPGQTTRPPVVVGPTIVYATTSFSCRNGNGTTTTYTVSVDGGRCNTNGTSNTPATGASCYSSGSNLSSTANCASGCGNSVGSGSCTQVTQ
jgi:hypothetical protein